MVKLSVRSKAQYEFNKNNNFYTVDPPFPKTMEIEVTNACNHACVFCTNPHMTRKKRVMDSSLILRIMRDARELGTDELGLYTTGEPLLVKDLPMLITEGKGMGFGYIYISTNGALATPQKAHEIIDAGIDSIKFSINAGTRETYLATHKKDEWDLVINNLKYISNYRKTLKKPLYLFVTYVVTQKNRHEKEAFKAMIEPFIDEVMFFEQGDQSSYMKALAPQTGKSHQGICNLPFNRFYVTCEGYMTSCCVDYQNYLATSDLKVVSLKEAWHSQAVAELRRKHITGELAGTLCGNCWQNRNDKITPLNNGLAVEFDPNNFLNKL